MNCFEYKKHKQLRSISSEMPFSTCFHFLRITYLNWSVWHAVHSCNCNGKWTITAQRHTICHQRCNAVVTAELRTSAHYCVAS